MIASNSFIDSSDSPSPLIIFSKAAMSGVSISITIIQKRSPQKSVITFMVWFDFFMSFCIARVFSTMGFTLPGLQYMISRSSSIPSPFVVAAVSRVYMPPLAAGAFGFDGLDRQSGVAGHADRGAGDFASYADAVASLEALQAPGERVAMAVARVEHRTFGSGGQEAVCFDFLPRLGQVTGSAGAAEHCRGQNPRE